MDYLHVAKTALLCVWYLVYPLILLATTLLNVLLLALAPALHLAGYTVHACLLPVRVLAKFETLYIFVGVAAVVGILTGSLLHLTSSILVSALDLQSSPDDDEYDMKRGLRSLSGAAERRRQRTKSAARTMWSSTVSSRRDEKSYVELVDTDRSRGRGGLLSQTILEEDDDSAAGF